MSENLTKICRICLTEGSRNIFQKTVTRDALYNVSSLNRISEKLRYVTLLKVDEMENLPPMICDLCIVQLNVAYNFKRQATESDNKLRQYLIENGIDVMKDPQALPLPRSSTSNLSRPALAITAGRSQRINSVSSSLVEEVSVNQNITTNAQPLNPRLLPIRIKVETSETVEPTSDVAEVLSNSTISPTSTGTTPTTTIGATNASKNTERRAPRNTSEPIAIESSPSSSSKDSFTSSGRDSTMVVVNSDSVTMHGDEDYVQNILRSRSSMVSSNITITSGSTTPGRNNKATPTRPSETLGKHSATRATTMENTSKEKGDVRLDRLLSSLNIDMVTTGQVLKCKLRIKPKKKKDPDSVEVKQNISSKPKNHTPDNKLSNRIKKVIPKAILTKEKEKIIGKAISKPGPKISEKLKIDITKLSHRSKAIKPKPVLVKGAKKVVTKPQTSAKASKIQAKKLQLLREKMLKAKQKTKPAAKTTALKAKFRGLQSSKVGPVKFPKIGNGDKTKSRSS